MGSNHWVLAVLCSPKVPQALIDSSVHLALYSSMLYTFTSSVPQAPQKVNCTVCSSSSVVDTPPSGSVQTARQGRFHTLSGLVFLRENQSWAATLPPMSCDVIWVEPRSTQPTSALCDGMAHCLGWPVVHPGKVIRSLLFSHQKESLFV